jgi:glyoxylase-like metal-dependent hydrolase (beta-lactamase superfamily II)
MVMRNNVTGPCRREFLMQGGSCSAWLLALTTSAPAAMKRLFSAHQKNDRLFEEKWGWIEKLDDNVWSHIAAPFESRDFTTLCNGGIVAGSDRVLAIESFMQPAGARWLAERCKELTGRWPTDVIVTHYHADHVSGFSGYQHQSTAPRLWTTGTTRDLVQKSGRQENPFALPEQLTILDESRSTEIDLGGRMVKINPAAGHTTSDLTVEVPDAGVVFTGDLFFHRLVPNFSDALPERLDRSVEDLLQHGDVQFVPGHGTMATPADLKKFRRFLATLESAARKAHAAGKTAEAAASEFRLEAEFADWYLFADDLFLRGFRAWYRQL